ncbi:MAG: UDP-N-acetylmuramate dehydrogenase [Candidatus Ratteibacteria bacterium]
MKQPLIQIKLEGFFSGKVVYDLSAKEITTFKTGGCISCVAHPAKEEDLYALYRLKRVGIPVKFVGAGSNLLVSDKGFQGVIVVTSDMNIVRDTGSAVECEPGLSVRGLLRFALEKDLTGFEFLAGIPGTIGGAVWMNAGTRDMGIASVLEELTFVDMQGVLRKARREEIPFEYRRSGLEGKAFCITRIFLQRILGDSRKSRAMIASFMERRYKTQPLNVSSAGSVFKNPSGNFAGELIDSLGFKGMRAGGAEISKKHANFIVNTGNASSKDIYALITLIQRKVKEAYGIDLELEIELIGDFE